MNISFKALIFLIFAFFKYSNGISQNGGVEGLVSSNGVPQPFASIYLDNTQVGTYSDSSGFYRISNIEAGDYTLVAEAMGYEKGFIKIKIEVGEIITIHFDLIENVKELEEVVISGTLKEVSKSQSPIPVEVYTKEYFKKNPTPSLFESLQMINGVQPQLNCNVCNTGDIHINGMEGPYTMVTIDGMPIVSSLSTVYGLSGIPNSMIQRVEVVKGPASTLYGSEAVGGLINIITKDATSSPKFAFDAFATSHGEYNIDASFRKKTKKATALVGLNYFNFQNRRDVNQDNFTDITLQNRFSVFNKWNFERKNKRYASMAFRYVYEDRWGGETQWSKEFRGTDSVYGESIFTSRVEILGTYQVPVNKEKILFQYSVNYHHQNSVYGTIIYNAIQSVAFGQLLWDKKIGARNNILLGVPFRYTYYDDNTPATAQLNSDSISQHNFPQKTVLPGMFLQDEITINEKLSSLAGIRYDYNSLHGTIVSPRLSFKYVLNTNTVFRLSSGNGYRVVNIFTEDHAALTGARQVIITGDLHPERSWNGNVNIQEYIDHKFGFIGIDASAFYTYFTNKIVGDFITDPNKIIYSNLNGYAVSKGITLNTEYSFLFPLKVMLGATLMKVYSVNNQDNDTKIPQRHAPGFSGTFALTYKFNKLKMTIDYTGRVMGPMYLPVVQNDYRPEKSPWFSIQNIQVTKFIARGWEIYGGVKNLLNFIPKDPLLRPFDPFDKNISVNNPNNYTFDTSYNYAPIQGIRGFLGIRYTIPAN